MLKKYGRYFAGVITLLFLTSFSASADVSVYAEGAYTDDDLMVYIYADVTGSPLVSYGVKLTYDTLEVEIPTPDSVIKNDGVWYFGTAAAPLATPNADPDVSTPGYIVIVGGKIDESAPTAGVSGDRQLIAVVTFDRVDFGPVPTTIGLELGKVDPYANFVQVDSTVLDTESAPAFDIGNVEVYQRGDANGDGLFTNTDYFKIKYYLQNGIYVCYADCNGDNLITNTDYFCVKNKM